MEAWVMIAIALATFVLLYLVWSRKSAPRAPAALDTSAAPAASAPSAPPAGIAKQRKAVEVTDAELEQYLQDPSKPCVVLFHSPGCGHCKAMLPAFQQYGQVAGANVHVLMIDCSRFFNVAERFKIGGFPTIKLVDKGKEVKEYEGDRKVGSFMAFHSGN
jgi:thioredoxin-like negative regulator of GroEL